MFQHTDELWEVLEGGGGEKTDLSEGEELTGQAADGVVVEQQRRQVHQGGDAGRKLLHPPRCQSQRRSLPGQNSNH